MKHLFVPYELAKLAKEKGVEPITFMSGYYEEGDSELKIKSNLEYDVSNMIIAPLHQQLVDWFREKYEYNVIVVGCEMLHEKNEDGIEGTKGGYTWCINKRSKVVTALWYPAIEDYYECFNKALEQAFKHIPDAQQ